MSEPAMPVPGERLRVNFVIASVRSQSAVEVLAAIEKQPEIKGKHERIRRGRPARSKSFVRGPHF
eukprot:6323468-Lingulodinium_polyedra.AAC.1